MLERLAIAVACALGTSGAGLAVAADATAASVDTASTHAYIRANYAYSRATMAKIPAAHAKIAVFTRKLARECPNVGKDAPENEASQPMSYEVAVALWSIAYDVDAGPIRAFAGAINRLRWSNPKLTRLARGYASDLQKLVGLSMPNLCSDVSAWRETGYRTMPAGTLQLTTRVEAIQPHTIPARLLARYASAADRRTLTLTGRLERKIKDNETVVGWDEWERALYTLGLEL
jgi:hypothetical protein